MGEGQFEGRVCVVTGGAGGLGRAIAAALGAGGGRHALCDVLTDELEQTARDLRAAGCEVFAAPCDVSDSANVDAFFAQVEQAPGPVEVLVNNAALVPGAPEDEARRSRHYAYLTTPEPRTSLGFTSAMEDAEWLKYWGVNVHGVFFCTRAALRQAATLPCAIVSCADCWPKAKRNSEVADGEASPPVSRKPHIMLRLQKAVLRPRDYHRVAPAT